jgi:CelD/BcsL family acetyltransferase involved in cellulose biosynthesis
MSIEVIQDEAGWAALRPEWDDLWTQAAGRFEDSYLACELAWRHVVKPRGGRLCCVVARSAGQVVLVWPLVATRQNGAVILRPCGPDAADSTALLIAPGLPPGLTVRDLLTACWHDAVRACGADQTLLPYLPDASPLLAVARAAPHVLAEHSDQVTVQRMPKGVDWQAHWHSLTGRRPGRRERKLARQGVVTVRELTGADTSPPGELDGTQVVAWMLHHKRRWAAAAGKHGPWLSDPGYASYLTGALRQGGAVALVLCLDDVPVAAALLGTGSTSANGMLIAFDPQWAAFSPGMILLEHCLRWVVGRRLDFDLGPGGEGFKSGMGHDQPLAVRTIQVAHTRRGRLLHVARQWARSLASRRGPRAARSGVSGPVPPAAEPSSPRPAAERVRA